MQPYLLTLPPSPARRLANLLLFALGLAILAMAADSIVSARASAAPAASDRYTLSGNDVRIYNLAGEAKLEAGTGTSVVVTVDRQGDDSAKLDIETGPIGGSQTLRVIYPGDRVVYPPMGRGSSTETRIKDDGTFGDGKHGYGSSGHRVRISGSGDGIEAWADLRVSVPKGQQLTLRLACGPVTVTNVDGDLMVDTGSGNVIASGSKGDLKIDTGSGNVEVTQSNGRLDIDTGSGDVNLTGVRGEKLAVDTGSGGIKARDLTTPTLSFDTGSGDIVARGLKATTLKFDTGSGSVEVELLQKAESLDVDTGSGDVTVRVPDDMGADISFESGSGGFDTDLPVTVRERDHGSFRGRLRDGTGRIVVETGSGDLRLASNRASH